MGPPNAALFLSKLGASIVVEIWALEGYSAALMLQHPVFYLDGGAEF